MALYSRVTYAGTGAVFNASFSFPYLNTSDIYVYVDGVSVPYTFLNTSTVTPVTNPVSGAVVQVRRDTQKTASPVDFTDGSVILERDLDLLATYNLYLAQEASDTGAASITLNTSNLFDAQDARVVNLANPVDAGDAVNKGTIDNLYPFVATVGGSIANVNIVGAAISNVGVVAGSIANVNTVALNNTNVNKVAAVDADVTTVANNDANVSTVAGSIASVNTAAGSIANVNTVGTAIINVNTVAANITSVNTVAGNNANVSKVGAIDTKVTTVANNDANVTTVAGISSAVSTVAGISGNVTTVATNNANVTAVANNAANINTVSGNTGNINSAVANTANINAVVANATNINTVAGINADVTTVASNIAAILDAPNQASGAAASAVSAASSASSAAALLDNFDDRYLGAKASDVSVDNDGNALIVGALYYNTTDGVMKVYTAAGWIAASSASVATLATYEFVATASQTVFTGADAGGQTLSYTSPAIMLTMNGVRLRPDDDYTATDGVNITLALAANAGDELVVDAFGNFLIADTYSKAQADSLIATKQDVLTSGTNIKTLNGESLLGSTDITITVSYDTLTGAVPTWNQNTTGNAATATSATTAGNGGVTSVNGATGAVTLSTGGVTSLNGQTGAITNTDYTAIGSYIHGRPANITSYAINAILAGSSLYATTGASGYYPAAGGWMAYAGAAAQTLISTGTWRCVSPANGNGTTAGIGLWVRIS